MRIPLFKNFSDAADVREISKIIKSGSDWAIGSKITLFENAIASFLKVKYALSFNSGTSALHALMASSGLKAGNEVIVPSFSFIATANAPLFVGAKPVFADIEEDGFSLDPTDVEKKITKRTKAIMPIHYGGFPAHRLATLKTLAKKHNLLFFEDAAESLGASLNGKKVGSFGDAAMFSLCGPKVISSGEGGLLVTNSKKIAALAKLFRSHGRLDKANYFSTNDRPNYTSLGYNFRLSNLAASLALSQFQKINTIIKLRQNHAASLASLLSELKEIQLPTKLPGADPVFQMFTIRVKAGQKTRDALKNFLNKNGIGAKVYFDPIHQTSFYQKLGYGQVRLPITEKVSAEVLTLPMYPSLKNSEINYIAAKVKKFFK